MHCRAYLLLEREYSKILKSSEWGIQVTPSESNIFCWYATIRGLNDSIWEGGQFHLTIRFNENYDDEDPEIKFNTIPFHPNINPLTGEPCIDLFKPRKDEANRKISIVELLVNLQALLSNPILENAVNTEAASLICTAPHIYTQLVKNCVSESRKLMEVLKGQDLEKASKDHGKVQYFSSKKPSSSVNSYSKRAKQVSFDEYHRGWVRLASSQPFATISYAYSSKIGTDPILGISDNQTAEGTDTIDKRAISPAHSNISKAMASDTEQKLSKMREKKLQKITAMKQLYLNSVNDENPGRAAPVSSLVSVSKLENRDETWEKEADELVAWTSTLQEDLM